jgi:hypothetical protein
MWLGGLWREVKGSESLGVPVAREGPGAAGTPGRWNPGILGGWPGRTAGGQNSSFPISQAAANVKSEKLYFYM